APGVVEIRAADELLAILLRSSYSNPGIHFLTAPDLSQQLAFMSHPTGKVIEPHLHNAVVRQVRYTQEPLFIRRGRIRVDFYDESQRYLQSYELFSGDVILLIKGGHGFEVLDDAEFIEIKQGPYAGEGDKTRFAGIQRCDAKVSK